MERLGPGRPHASACRLFSPLPQGIATLRILFPASEARVPAIDLHHFSSQRRFRRWSNSAAKCVWLDRLATRGFLDSGKRCVNRARGRTFSDPQFPGGLMAIDGKGQYLFLIDRVASGVWMFQIQSDGSLKRVSGSPFFAPAPGNVGPAPASPVSLATEHSGQFGYVGYASGDAGHGAIIEFQINVADPANPQLVPGACAGELLRSGLAAGDAHGSKGCLLICGARRRASCRNQRLCRAERERIHDDSLGKTFCNVHASGAVHVGRMWRRQQCGAKCSDRTACGHASGNNDKSPPHATTSAGAQLPAIAPIQLMLTVN
jgi:hypothetical protein